MTTVADIYERFSLTPTLQQHQLRVAAVAYLICQNLEVVVNQEEIVWGCLLHDMGNLVKFDLARYPDLAEPEGVEYWLAKQKDFVLKYGTDEHQATAAILRELNVSPRLFEIATSVGFHNIKNNFASGDLHLMIPEYADDRVTPWGVVSLDERLHDLEQRYRHRYPSEADERRRREFAQVAHDMEATIFSRARITPADITEQRVAALVPELLKMKALFEV